MKSILKDLWNIIKSPFCNHSWQNYNNYYIAYRNKDGRLRFVAYPHRVCKKCGKKERI